MQNKQQAALSRRNFLRAFGGASTAAVATVALTPTEALAYDPGQQEMRARYQETDHIKAYYRVNRYPEHK
jgi:hypothetical protein